MQKRGRQLKKIDGRRKREADEKGKAVRKAKRQHTSAGQEVQASLLAEPDWRAALLKLTVPKLTALGISLGMTQVPKTPKAAVLGAVEPIVQEWMDLRPATRAETADASE